MSATDPIGDVSGTPRTTTTSSLTPMAVATKRTVPGSLAALGVVTILVSAWGAIVPYVGPVFGYSADGARSWTWNLAHGVLGLVPGVAGMLAGFAMIAAASRLVLGVGRVGIGGAGFVAAVCGAWFTIGPSAWPVLSSFRAYFLSASPFRTLVDAVGYALGPGLILAACGGCAVGWAIRHRAAAAPAGAVAASGGLRVHPTAVSPVEDA